MRVLVLVLAVFKLCNTLQDVEARTSNIVIENVTVISRNDRYCPVFDVNFDKTRGVNGTLRIIRKFTDVPNIVFETKVFRKQSFVKYSSPRATKLCRILNTGNCGNLRCPIVEGDYHICNVLPELPVHTKSGLYMVNLQVMDGAKVELLYIRIHVTITKLLSKTSTPFTTSTTTMATTPAMIYSRAATTYSTTIPTTTTATVSSTKKSEEDESDVSRPSNDWGYGLKTNMKHSKHKP